MAAGGYAALAKRSAGSGQLDGGEAGNHSQSMPAEKITLVSTHGAGDCFMGMLCTTLLNGDTLANAVGKANRAAAQHVSRKA